jgi:hypothetical protein
MQCFISPGSGWCTEIVFTDAADTGDGGVKKQRANNPGGS